MKKGLTKKQRLAIKAIGERIPEDLTKRLIKQEVDTSVEDEIRQIIESKNPIYSEEERQEFARLLNEGKFRIVRDVVDAEVEKEIADYWDKELKLAIERGELPPRK